MMGTVTVERFTFRGSPEVPSPLSSHEPPPSVALKKSPLETRSRSEAPSTAWTNQRTRRANPAIEDNMYETRSPTYFSTLGCAFIASLSRYPGANVSAPVRDRRPRVGKHVELKNEDALSAAAERVHGTTWRQLRFRRFRGWNKFLERLLVATWFGQVRRTFSRLTVSTINEGQCIENSRESSLH